MVHCKRCGGTIDEKLRKCKSCNSVYSQNEIEKLKEEEILKQWLLGNVSYDWTESEYDKAGSSDSQIFEKWLAGDEKALEEWLMGKSSESISIPSIEKKDFEVPTKPVDIRKHEEDIEEIKKKLVDLLQKTVSGEIDVKKLLEENTSLSKRLSEEIKLRKELEEEVKKLREGTQSIIRALRIKQKDFQITELNELENKLREELEEKRKLQLEVERLQKDVEILRKHLEERLSELPEDVRNIREKEIELKRKENEIENLKKMLEEERAKIESLERDQEVKGYEELKAKMIEEIREKEEEFRLKEEELRAKIIELESELNKLRIEVKQKEDLLKIEGKLDEKVKDLMDKIVEYEKEISEKDKRIRELMEDLKMKDEKLKSIEEKIRFKEEELNRREQDLLFREKKLMEELRRVEAAKAELSDIQELQLKQRLEELQDEIRRKEEELIRKQKYLEAKERELKAKEKELIEEELSKMEEEIIREFKEEKVKSGTRRLDDLLFGGIPIGSNVLIYGPAYTGKEILVYSFIAEGLKKGVPAIIILTDKALEQIREDMKYILPTYDQYELLGLVRYVDAYSRAIGDTHEEKGVLYVNQQTNIGAIMNYVDMLANEFKQKVRYYRLAFFSLSSLLTFLDQKELLRFLQPFTTKRKREKAVCMYVVEKGLHTEQEVQAVSATMDGTIEFKIEHLKTYLRVLGITEAQSRDWIEVYVSKSGVNLGSFTLGHIR